MTDLNIDGMAIAPGVVETIVSIAANEVDGVASVGPSATSGLRAMFAFSYTHLDVYKRQSWNSST